MVPVAIQSSNLNRHQLSGQAVKVSALESRMSHVLIPAKLPGFFFNRHIISLRYYFDNDHIADSLFVTCIL